MEKVACGGKDYLVDRANLLVYDFEDGLNEVLDPEPVRPNPPTDSRNHHRESEVKCLSKSLHKETRLFLQKRWRRSSRKMSVVES